MGVSRTDYIVYGWKLPYELKDKNGKIDLWADKFLPYIEGHKGVDYTLISDGMCGDYNVFGRLLKHAGDDGDGWGFTNLDLAKIDAEEVKAKYREVFELDKDELIAEPYLFIFSHYS
jgi:hypothetical protein